MENLVHDLISYQASRYYEGSKGIGEAVYHKVFFLWKFSAVDAFCHVTLKVTCKMYPQHLIKNNILSTPSITEQIPCAFILLWSLYRYHTQRNLTLFHLLFWAIHSIVRLNVMLSRASCFHKLKNLFQGHRHDFANGVLCTSVAWYHIRPFVLYSV